MFLRLYNNGVFTTTGFKKGSKFSGRKSGRIKEYHEWYFVICKKNLPQIEFATWFAPYFAFHSRKTKMGFQCHCDLLTVICSLWYLCWFKKNYCGAISESNAISYTKYTWPKWNIQTSIWLWQGRKCQITAALNVTQSQSPLRNSFFQSRHDESAIDWWHKNGEIAIGLGIKLFQNERK